MKKNQSVAILVDVTKFNYRKNFPECRHTAEGRCPGIAIAMTCSAGDFSSLCDEKQNVCDAVAAPAVRRAGWPPRFRGVTSLWNNLIWF